MNLSAQSASVRAVMHELAAQECPRESYALLAERIRQMEATGAAVPDELRRESSRLLVECRAQSQGR